MKKVELLAPVGDMECLEAALIAGCDAVYLGGKSFGARSHALNFSDEEMLMAINKCHLYGVKIYVTLNTLIYEEEVDNFINYVDFLHRNNIDAVILQDIGMMDLLRKKYPNLELHASTQMHIHNIEGVKLLKKLGIKRVVLARETSIDCLKDIKSKTSMDIECFIHGALCVSYSGQCLMSSLIGGRSANRGNCVGCCRLKYDVLNDKSLKINKDEYPLSLRDLNTLENIKDLIESGIDSFKIEGRMKRPEYVYLVTSIYRKAIDYYYKNKSLDISNSIRELEKIYNRYFTKGFLFNDYNISNPLRPNHMGVFIGKVISNDNYLKIKIVDDISNGDGIRIIGKNDIGFTITSMFVDGKQVISAKKGSIITIKDKYDVLKDSIVVKTTDKEQINSVRNILKNNKRKVLITGKIILKINKKIVLKISDGKNEVIVESIPLVEKANNYPITKDQVLKQITKIGNTIYEFDNLDIECDKDIYVNIKILNDLKREATDKLDNLRLYRLPYKENRYEISLPSFNVENTTNVLIDSIKDYKKIKDKKIDKIYVENNNLYNNISSDDRVILKIPRVNNNYINNDNLLLVGEIGSINKYKNINTDFSLNVTNSYSVAFLHSLGVKKITLSLELEDEQINNLVSNYISRYKVKPNLEVIVYGREEMMINKFDLYNYYNVTNSKLYLQDRYKNVFPIVKKNNLNYIYNCKELNRLKTNYYKMGINSIRYNFIESNFTDF